MADMKNDCLSCFLAKWEYLWCTCRISKQTYADGDKNFPKKCPYGKMTLEEIKKAIKE